MRSANTRKRLGTALLALLPLSFSAVVCGEPWINAADERTRHHLLVLSDSGKLHVPLSTWPVMWSGVKRSLDEMKVEELSETELWSYRYLRHALKRAMRENEFTVKVRGASHPTAINDFSTDMHDEAEALLGTAFTGEFFSLKLQKTFVHEPLDGYEARYDGSYLAATLGNWVFGLGTQDRWWGPGWQSSMILSQNGRPTPSFFIQRKDTSARGGSIFTPLGWDLSFFTGVLERDRYIEYPYFSGARATLKPARFLEIGVSSTLIWGGDVDIPEQYPEPEDYQLVAADWRLGHNFSGLQFALYHQYSYTNHSPSETANTFGLEVAGKILGVNSRIAVESNNNQHDQHSFYEHDYYQNGYRRHERSLGSSLDTAAKGLSLLADHYLLNGHQLGWRLGKAQLNNDNSEPLTASNAYTDNALDISYGQLSYKIPLTGWLQIEAGAIYYSDTLQLADKDISSGGYIQLNLDF